jgi:hypothetical protein
MAPVLGCDAPAATSEKLPELYVSALNVPQRSWHPVSEGLPAPERLSGMMIYEVTQYEMDKPPSAEQRAAATSLIERVRAAARARGWYDYERARADGFYPIYGDRTHFAKLDYVFDDAILDPERPEVLMYAKTNRGRKLAGVMFYVRKPDEHGPQIGGPLTLWHYHVWPKGACLVAGMIPIEPLGADGRCPTSVFTHQSPEMMHVWLIEHPQGPFSTNMTLPHPLLKKLLEAEEVEALEHEHGEGGEHGDPADHAEHGAHEHGEVEAAPGAAAEPDHAPRGEGAGG